MSEPLPEDEIAPYGGCDWPLDPACLGDEWDAFDEDVQARASGLASETLHRLTAGRVGGCPVKVRPCQQSGCWSAFVPFHGYSALSPGLDTHGNWINSCGCGGSKCASSCEIKLPAPIGRLDEVLIDGEEQDLNDFRVDNGKYLVWVGAGDCPFPASQDLSLPDTEEDTFSITYLNAYPVDSLGSHAAGLLAVEFAKACSGNKCRLPKNVTEVSRSGVTFQVTPGLFPGGFTGIQQIDAFIELWNPEARTQPTRVWSPDMTTFRRSGV